ncbi:MAG: hypothetical protein KDD50_09720 [Bdellovibrionales bacterium]|nr:hypothetical protein [Bdellovibrionales bacterium]
MSKRYQIQWERSKLDLAELARKRWIEKWSVPKMAKYFERSPETIQMHICHLRKGKINKVDLCPEERRLISLQLFEVFKGQS